MRWRIAVLVSVAIAISYLDRQTLPVAVNAIGRDIPLSNEQFSTLHCKPIRNWVSFALNGMARPLRPEMAFGLRVGPAPLGKPAFASFSRQSQSGGDLLASPVGARGIWHPGSPLERSCAGSEFPLGQVRV